MVGKLLIRLLFTSIAVIIGGRQSIGQNLVPNPSFEEYDKIFYNFVQSKEDFDGAVRYWQMPTTGTTDIFTNFVDKANNNNPHSTSNIAVGAQEPIDGDFMIGLISKSNLPKYREYAQVELLQPLVARQLYFAGFYVSLADNMQYASNNIGILFTEDKVESSDYTPLLFKPQVNSDNIIEEKINWILFSSTFTASKPFNYLTLGNFYSDENTEIKKVSNSITDIRLKNRQFFYFLEKYNSEVLTPR